MRFLLALPLALIIGCKSVEVPEGMKPNPSEAASGPKSGPYQWRNVPVGGGGFVSGLLFHPKEKDLLYARTDVGGAYRWDAKASRWIPLNDDADRSIAGMDITGTLSFAVDPQDVLRLYLAVGIYTQDWWPGHASLLISKDRGRSFKRVALPFKLGGNVDGRGCGERLQVDPGVPEYLYLGTNQDGLWRSTDQGRTWAKMAGFTPTSTTFVYVDPSSSNLNAAYYEFSGTPEELLALKSAQRLLVGVADPTIGLMHSKDAGKTWEPVNGWPQGLMALRWTQAGSKILITASDSIGPNNAKKGGLFSLDLAKGELKELPVPKTEHGFGGVSVESQDPQVIVVSTLNRWQPKDEVFRSVDGGKTWKPLLEGATWDFMGFPYVEKHTPHWIADVKIDPNNPDRALWVTGYGIYASRNLTGADQGKPVTWAFENAGLEETVPLRLASPPWGAPLHSAMGDQNGFTHEELDKAATRGPGEPPWGTCTSLATSWGRPGVVARVGHFEDGKKGVLSLDGGKSWAYFADQAGAKGPGKIGVSTDGELIIWCPENADCLRSNNQGKSWRAVKNLPQNVEPQADTVDPELFFAMDLPKGALYRSQDGGESFEALPQAFPPNSDINHVDVRPVPGLKGHVWVGEDQGLWASADAGKTFTKVGGVEEANRLGFGAAAPESKSPSAYIVGKVGGVYGFWRSDDAGKAWTRINTDKEQFGYINAILGDARVYGRAYIATGGRGS